MDCFSRQRLAALGISCLSSHREKICPIFSATWNDSDLWPVEVYYYCDQRLERDRLRKLELHLGSRLNDDRANADSVPHLGRRRGASQGGRGSSLGGPCVGSPKSL